MPPRRVLVADDQQATRRGLRAFLAALPGVEWVGEATNGYEAMRLAAECQPDVVLMDARMPEMGGVEAMRQIKSQTPTVKVIMLTMYDEYRAEALAAGADSFLVKGEPFGPLKNAICNA